MLDTKKTINKIKTQKFLNEFSIKFLLQHKNFTVNDWFEFTQKIQEISENSAEILNVKNSLLKKSLVGLNDNEKITSLCQGPNFLIGCRNENHLKVIWNFINSNSKVIFISCFYKNQLLNHLDLETFLKTDFSVYLRFLNIIEKKRELTDTLQYHLKMHPLILLESNCISALENLKEFKSKK